MTPLEINKKIAEVKGFEWRAVKTDFEGDCYRGEYAFDNNACRFFNWSENLTDAWQLFEEMPIGYCVSSTRKGFVCFFWPSGSEQWPSGDGETAPLAICLAWLKWKGAL